MKAVCLSVQAGEHSSLLRFDDFGRSGDGRPYAVGVTGCPGGGGKAVGPNGETRSPKAYVRPLGGIWCSTPALQGDDSAIYCIKKEPTANRFLLYILYYLFHVAHNVAGDNVFGQEACRCKADGVAVPFYKALSVIDIQLFQHKAVWCKVIFFFQL